MRSSDAPSLERAREISTEGGGGSVSVRNVLSRSGSGSVNFGSVDLGFVGGNFQEYGGGTCGVPQIGDGKIWPIGRETGPG